MYRRILFLIVLLYLVLGTLYSVTTPLFEAPDEVWHFAFVRQVAFHYNLPIARPELQLPWAQEATQPPLYYVAAAPVIGWMDARALEKTPDPNPFARIGQPEAGTNDNRNAFLHSADEAFPYHDAALAVHLLRWFSIALGAATILFTAALAREIFPDQPALALVAAAFTAFLPQFLFITSAINNDNIAALFITASLWQLARVRRTGLSISGMLLLGVLIGLAALTKLSGLGLVPLTLLALLWLILPSRAWRWGLACAAVLGATVALVAGWWYVRNLMLYNDALALAPMTALIGGRAVPLSFDRWLTAESEGLRLSTWGVFGWFNILASPAFYSFFDGLALVGALGGLFALVKRRYLSAGVLALALWCLWSFIALWRFSSIIAASQGRLLFPALPAYAILWSWGVLALFAGRLAWVGGAMVGAQFLVAAAAPALFIAPAYVPTVLPASALPTAMTRLDWHFEDGSEWLGVAVDRQELAPGDSVGVTLYERLPAPSASPAALYLHVVNSAETIVAQRDSLPGAGNPVSPAASVILADSYRVTIPLTAPAPNTWHLEAGLYDPATGKRLAATDSAGKPLEDGATLALLRAKPAEPWAMDFDGRAVLDNAEFDQLAITPATPLHLKLYWRKAGESLRVFAHVLGDQEHVWAAADAVVAQDMQLELRLDAATPPGVYPVEVGVYPALAGDRLSVFDAHGQMLGDRLFLGPVRVK